MSIISFSIPKGLVLALKRKLEIPNFVETGTSEGNICFWTATYFKNVYTIEISAEISKRTAAKVDCPKNIEFIVGDSKEKFPELMTRLKGQTMFWLDSHWCWNGIGKDYECSLLQELNAISSCENPIILINNARYFLGPIPSTHNCENCPTIDQVFDICRNLFPGSFTTIIDDVIVCVPKDLKNIVDEYWMETFHDRYNRSDQANSNFSDLKQKLYNKGKSTLKRIIFPNKKTLQQIEEERRIWEKNQWRKSNQWLIDINIQEIVDIGANTGQFAKKMRLLFPDKQIYSFEPIPEVYRKLKENFTGDLLFKAYNTGIGDEKDTLSFNLNDFSDSSSFLKMKNLHKESFPYTKNETQITVPVEKLDDLLTEKLKQPYLLKIDVQGYEEKVIKGGKQIVSNAEIIIIETSFAELYEDQPLFDSIYNTLKLLGFDYIGNFEQLYSPINHSILQADAIFRKRKL